MGSRSAASAIILGCLALPAAAMPLPPAQAAAPVVEVLLICGPNGCRHMYKPYRARPYQQRYVNSRYYR